MSSPLNPHTMYQFYKQPLSEQAEKMVLDVFKLFMNYIQKEQYSSFYHLKESALCVQIHINLAEIHPNFGQRATHYTIARVCLMELKTMLLSCMDLGELGPDAVNPIREHIYGIEYHLGKQLRRHFDELDPSKSRVRKLSDLIGTELQQLEPNTPKPSDLPLNEEDANYLTVFEGLEEWWEERKLGREMFTGIRFERVK